MDLDQLTTEFELFRRNQSVRRGLAAFALGHVTGQDPMTIHARAWGKDQLAATVTRAAVSPTTSSALGTTTGFGFLRAIASESSALKLCDAAPKVDLSGVVQVSVPSVTMPVPIFTAEGAPMRMVDGVAAASIIGPERVIRMGTSLTGELEFMSPQNASLVLGRALNQATSKGLDAVFWDAVAADAVRPAGIRNGVTPIAAGADMVADVRNIASAIAGIGGDPDRVMYFASTKQAVTLKLTSGPKFTNAVTAVPSLADGTLIGIDPQMIASSVSDAPTIEISREAVAHFENATPLAIGTPGSPDVVASPVRSAFQHNLLFIKVRLRATWGVLAAGGVQVVTGTAW